MMEQVEDLSEEELLQRLGAAALDGDATMQAALQRERERRSLQPLAAAEARRRQTARQEEEAAALLQKLATMLDELRSAFLAKLDELAVTPATHVQPVLGAAYELGRQIYTLSHDLVAATGDRQRFFRRYDVPDQLILRGGAAAQAFLSNQGKTQCATPWSEDIARLRTLMLRKERIGNGG